jgi:hypothetical protein
MNESAVLYQDKNFIPDEESWLQKAPIYNEKNTKSCHNGTEASTEKTRRAIESVQL